MSTPARVDGRATTSTAEPFPRAGRRIASASALGAIALAVPLVLYGLLADGPGQLMVGAGAAAVAAVAGWQLVRRRPQPAVLVALVLALALVVFRGSLSETVLGPSVLALAALAALGTIFVPERHLRAYLILLGGLWLTQVIPAPRELGRAPAELLGHLVTDHYFGMALQLGLFVATLYGLRVAAQYVASADRRYRLLYERVPVSVWDEDFTGVGDALAALREAGVVDLRRHLEQHPEVLDDIAEQIVVRNTNPAAGWMLEVEDPSVLLGRIDRRTVTEDTRRSYLEQFVAIWEGRDSVLTEVAGTTVSGRPFDGVLRWAAPSSPAGLDLANVVVTIDDVTALKAVQRDLAQTNGLLTVIAAAQRRFIAGTDADGVLGDLLGDVVRLTRCGFGVIAEVAGEEFGTVHAAVARAWHAGSRSFTHGGRRLSLAHFAPLLAAAVRRGEPVGTEEALALPFGADQPGVLLLGAGPGGFEFGLTDALQPVLSTSASLLAAFREEQLRRRAEGRLATVLDNASDMVWTMGWDGHIGYISSSVERILGYAQDELPGTPALDLVHPDDRAAVVAASAVGPGEITVPVVHRVRRADGSWLWMEASAANHLDDPGFSAWVVSSRDVTDRKRSADELTEAKESAEQAARAKTEFLANMSHEIRTPMNAILGMTELCLGTQLTAQQREYLGTVKSSIDVLLTLINDVLDLSRIEADRLELSSIPFSLRDVLGETVATLRSRATLKSLELDYEHDDDVPDGLVGDPGRLRQVLFNLIGNAIKFTHVGQVRVAAAVRSREERRTVLEFAVVDTGIGIPADRRDVIFRAFEQADGSMTRRFGGTGLGLAISQQLVEMMGGEIWVDSEPGRGTTFRFTAEFGIQGDMERIGLGRGAAAGTRTVLLLVQNESRRRSLAEVLRQAGFRLIVADDFAAMVELAAKARHHGVDPDVAVLCAGPGDERIVVEAAAEPALAGVALVVVASAGVRGDAQAMANAGAAAYLSHPLDAVDLIETVGLAGVRSGDVPLITRHWLRERRRRLRVLVVDDSPTNRLVATRLLEERGHTVEAAENGHLAVAAVADGGFDIVLMDVQMPVLDGLEATEIIRSAETGSGRHVPIVALTAHAMDGDRERCLAAGMDAFIAKPFRAEEIYAVVEQIAEARRS